MALGYSIFRESLKTHILELFESKQGTASGAMIEWEAFKVVMQGFCRGKTVRIKWELEKGMDRIENQMRKLEKDVIQD
mgnify:CR=1 FL=1